jgi:hypothetical protein
MKRIAKLVGIGVAACAACCAVPVGVMLFAGGGLAAAGAELINCYRDPLVLAVGGVFAAMGVAFFAIRLRARRKASACGCSDQGTETQASQTR